MTPFEQEALKRLDTIKDLTDRNTLLTKALQDILVIIIKCKITEGLTND